jgi:hypothetical protein
VDPYAVSQKMPLVAFTFYADSYTKNHLKEGGGEQLAEYLLMRLVVGRSVSCV